ncbi:MAG: hypothetical protein JXR96_00505 [Deltaproteobacteria bacterium]|nr:hypothetical protein [Deltaproteobacteria bacterium]
MASLCLAAALAFGCSGQEESQTDGGSQPLTCSSRLDCPGGLACMSGICSACLLNSDCLSTEICNPLDQLCVRRPDMGDECRLNEDCSLGSFCVQGFCKAASEIMPCLEDDDCLDGERCDPINLVCVTDFGCDRDVDCAEGEVCNTALNRCERACTPETQEAVCGFGLVCDEERGLCVECYLDEHCGIGLRCNPETHYCEGENTCRTDRDCPFGEVCNPQTHQCTVEPAGCLSHDDCPEGTLCDVPSGECIPADCQDDRLEPNGDPSSASPLEQGRTLALTLCPEDEDWFSVELARGDRLKLVVEMDFLASEHFHVELYDPACDDLLQAGSMLIDHTVCQDGAYSIRVWTEDARASYDIELAISRGVPCDDDEMEPNDSAYEAAPIVSGSLRGLMICPHDEDWYVLDRPLDRRLEARIEYPAMEGDLDLDLVGGDAQTIVMRSATGGDGEVVSVDDDPGTRFFLRVYGGPQTANQYEMHVELSPR